MTFIVSNSIYLKDIWPTGRKKLYYMFDFGDKWIFEVRKKRGQERRSGALNIRD
jgi:hypothetical protein